MNPKNFRPVKLSGCVLWLDAALGITVVTGVSQWDDQSGNDNHAVQATEADQPAYAAASTLIPGRPCLTFDGTSDRLTCNALASIATGADVPLSLFTVQAPTSVTGVRTLLSFGQAASATPFFALENAGAAPRLNRRDDASSNVGVTLSNISINVPHIYSAVFHGTTADVVYDGVTGTVAGALNTGTMTVDQFTVGALGRTTYSQFFAGDLFEVIAYSRALSLRERKQVERYLGHKYHLKAGLIR